MNQSYHEHLEQLRYIIKLYLIGKIHDEEGRAAALKAAENIYEHFEEEERVHRETGTWEIKALSGELLRNLEKTSSRGEVLGYRTVTVEDPYKVVTLQSTQEHHHRIELFEGSTKPNRSKFNKLMESLWTGRNLSDLIRGRMSIHHSDSPGDYFEDLRNAQMRKKIPFEVIDQWRKRYHAFSRKPEFSALPIKDREWVGSEVHQIFPAIISLRNRNDKLIDFNPDLFQLFYDLYAKTFDPYDENVSKNLMMSIPDALTNIEIHAGHPQVIQAFPPFFEIKQMGRKDMYHVFLQRFSHVPSKKYMHAAFFKSTKGGTKGLERLLESIDSNQRLEIIEGEPFSYSATTDDYQLLVIHQGNSIGIYFPEEPFPQFLGSALNLGNAAFFHRAKEGLIAEELHEMRTKARSVSGLEGYKLTPLQTPASVMTLMDARINMDEELFERLGRITGADITAERPAWFETMIKGHNNAYRGLHGLIQMPSPGRRKGHLFELLAYTVRAYYDQRYGAASHDGYKSEEYERELLKKSVAGLEAVLDQPVSMTAITSLKLMLEGGNIRDYSRFIQKSLCKQIEALNSTGPLEELVRTQLTQIKGTLKRRPEVVNASSQLMHCILKYGYIPIIEKKIGELVVDPQAIQTFSHDFQVILSSLNMVMDEASVYISSKTHGSLWRKIGEVLKPIPNAYLLAPGTELLARISPAQTLQKKIEASIPGDYRGEFPHLETGKAHKQHVSRNLAELLRMDEDTIITGYRTLLQQFTPDAPKDAEHGLAAFPVRYLRGRPLKAKVRLETARLLEIEQQGIVTPKHEVDELSVDALYLQGLLELFNSFYEKGRKDCPFSKAMLNRVVMYGIGQVIYDETNTHPETGRVTRIRRLLNVQREIVSKHYHVRERTGEEVIHIPDGIEKGRIHRLRKGFESTWKIPQRNGLCYSLADLGLIPGDQQKVYNAAMELFDHFEKGKR
ncbi:MAG: hypothetical protein ABIH34_05495 [Nanoarchaeota archaeon]